MIFNHRNRQSSVAKRIRSRGNRVQRPERKLVGKPTENARIVLEIHHQGPAGPVASDRIAPLAIAGPNRTGAINRSTQRLGEKWAPSLAHSKLIADWIGALAENSNKKTENSEVLWADWLAGVPQVHD